MKQNYLNINLLKLYKSHKNEPQPIENQVVIHVMENPILFFDGVCNLCNQAVQFIIKTDKEGIFRFASLQSDFAKEHLKHFNAETEKLETIYLLVDDKIYARSDAALEIVKKLGGFWQLFYVFKIVPSFIRDAVYNLISRNRYRWFGKQESCMIPSPELSARFLG